MSHAPRSTLTRFAITVAALSVALSACTNHDKTSRPQAITNRPQYYDRFIAVLRLKTPALLTSAHKVDGKVVVDQALKQQILAEQDTAVKELEALSLDLKILYRYRLVLNGVAVVAPRSLEARFRQLAGVSYVEGENGFNALPPVAESAGQAGFDSDLVHHNSVSFIGAQRVQTELKITGKGIRVGVIDTGVDYTHAMFGGAGTEAAYKAVDPTVVGSGFPSDKIVGGIDLVGTDFDSNAADFSRHIPRADANPLDEQGHGTHVSGTIAGRGDGQSTYDGVAPDAKIFAIKVFGKEGSTGDAVVIKALEVAANPSGDLDPSDHLDVINLSLGGGFGTSHQLYAEAVRNLVKGDTFMAASAGNSGANPYIVGAPSTSEEALSVAASVDGMEHNWQFGAGVFSSSAHPSLVSEEIEANFSKPIAEAGDVNGKLVFIGTAAAELSDQQKAAVRGHIALVDRGAVSFFDKAKRAEAAGATAVIVVNNVDGTPLAMGGGDGKVGVPAIMITKALGDTVKADMATGDVTFRFKTAERVEKPELVDTITDFSSRGPRSLDGLLKPEIAAPGANIISAKMGSGSLGVQFSGTSMASPHMAGVMALMKQAHPDLDVETLKSMVMDTALQIKDSKTAKAYALSTMGAGRVQAFAAVTAQLATNPPAVSLGEVQVDQEKSLERQVVLSNLSGQAQTLTLRSDTPAGLTVSTPASVTLAAHSSQTLTLQVKVAPQSSTDASQELGGSLVMSSGEREYRLPIFGVINRTTNLTASALTVKAAAARAAGAATTFSLVNNGQAQGEAQAFNLLGTNALDPLHFADTCSLQSVGWRLVKNGDQTLIQFAVKLFSPVTTWQLCDLSILVDGTGNGEAVQELLGTNLQTLNNNDGQIGTLASVLTDAGKMRQIRHDFEVAAKAVLGPAKPLGQPDFTPAIQDQQDYKVYGHSTLAIVSADLSKLSKLPNGDLKIKVATLADTTQPRSDDYLGGQPNQWLTLTPTAAGQAFNGLPEAISLAVGANQAVSCTKGGVSGDLVVYLPYNVNAAESTADQQQVVLTPKFAE